MSELDPSLKRLLKLSRSESDPEPEPAPYGFPARVAASAKRARHTTLFEELQERALGIACASLALVLAGTVVLLSQRLSTAPEPEISSAMNFVANNLLQ
jgi:hypothetical protein